MDSLPSFSQHLGLLGYHQPNFIEKDGIEGGLRFGFDPWVGQNIPRRREWQPTPVFSPGESAWMEEPGGLQSTGSQKQSDMAERLNNQKMA